MMDKSVKIEPVVSGSGNYTYCPIYGYYDLLPELHDECPKCNQVLDWDWFYKLKINK